MASIVGLPNLTTNGITEKEAITYFVGGSGAFALQ
jgi:hypothetical protein